MTTPNWLLPELSYAGEEHLDVEYVRNYEHKAGVVPENDLRLLLDLGLNKTHTLVDMGAGTGQLALAAASHCRRVVAVDVSPAMIHALQDKVTRLGVENVECVHSGFLSYEHQGDLADFVYTRHALHHLPDFWKALALQRTAAVLKPGGVLRLIDLIYSFEPEESEQVFETWFNHAAKRSEDGWTRSELETHIREEYSTFHWLLEPMLERAGFSIQNVNHSPFKVYSAYTCIKK